MKHYVVSDGFSLYVTHLLLTAVVQDFFQM